MIFNSFSPPLASTAKDVSHTSGAEAVVEGRKADVDKTVEKALSWIYRIEVICEAREDGVESVKVLLQLLLSLHKLLVVL